MRSIAVADGDTGGGDASRRCNPPPWVSRRGAIRGTIPACSQPSTLAWLK